MRIAVFYIILFFLAGQGQAQSFPHIQFSRLSEKDGLSSNQVNAIVQDKDGFIWIGTSDGLNRFDGYKVRSFHQIPNEKNSLIFNGVSSLVCDPKNGLWVCTSEGISYYNKQTGKFYNFRHDPADSNSIANDEYANVYVTDNNTAWVTSGDILYRFDSVLHYSKVKPVFTMTTDQKEITSYANLVQDRQNQLWGIAASFLFLLDKHTLHIKKRFGNCPGTLKTFYQDSHLQYWVGSFYGGLLRFNPINNSFQQVPLINKSTVVNSITEWKDHQGLTWLVAGTDAGVVLVDPVTLRSKLYAYLPGPMEPYSLSGNNVSCVFVDRQNILWIGTDNGVSYVRPSQQQFELWAINTSGELNREGVGDYVYSCDENGSGVWLSKWLSVGLFLVNLSGELQLKYVKSVPTVDSLKPLYVYCAGDRVLWCTTENALMRLNLQSGKMLSFKPPGNNFPIGLRTIVALNGHTWWIRTRNNGANGLYTFDPVLGKFTRHYECDKAKQGTAPMFIMDILRGNKGEVFLASRNDGLFQYDSNTDSFIHLFQFKGEQLLSHSNTFESIAEDENGLLWVGTFKGLFEFDPVTRKIVNDFAGNPVIGGVEISALRFDGQQNLWMNSNRGLFCLTPAGQIKHFNGTDGLPNNFAEGVLHLAKDGFMYSGFRNYLVRFRPDKLVKLSSPVANARFSEASVMDRPYFFHYNSTGEKEMVIPAGQNRFALDFSVMNYDDNNARHYYYRLGGAMDNWQQNENGHLVFYNISPGNYTLYVKGTDRQLPSPSEEDVVHITVEAFWWQTTTFWLGCLVVSVLLGSFMVRRHIFNIRRQAAFKQRLTEMEMTALRAQMNPHFIFNSLNSIENVIMQNKEREASDYLNKFARLIRLILENCSHNLITVAQDMEALQLYVDLEQFRFHNKFSYEVCIDRELLEGNYQVPPLLIQPFVENAIVHGIANSDRSDLRLAVHVRLDGDYIKYTIEDNGIGRKKAAMYHMHNGSKHKSVGLHITQERIHIFNRQQSSEDDVRLVDLYDEEDNAVGTRCEIKIKPV